VLRVRRTSSASVPTATKIVAGTCFVRRRPAPPTSAPTAARWRAVASSLPTSDRPVAWRSGPTPRRLAMVGPTSRARPTRRPWPGRTPAPQATIGTFTTSGSVPPCPPAEMLPWSDDTTIVSCRGSSVATTRPTKSSTTASAARYSGDRVPCWCAASSGWSMWTRARSADGTRSSGSAMCDSSIHRGYTSLRPSSPSVVTTAVRRPASFARRNTESSPTSLGKPLLSTPEAAGSMPDACAMNCGPLKLGNSARATTSRPSARRRFRTGILREASSRRPSTRTHTRRDGPARGRGGAGAAAASTAGRDTLRSLS